MKNILKLILFPFVFCYVLLALVIMKLGDGLHFIGNAMTGFRLDKSIGKIYSD